MNSPLPAAAPPLTPTQRAVLRALLTEGVRFMVIGGMAIRAHGVARQTRDLDLWSSVAAKNAHRIAEALGNLFRTPKADIEVRAARPDFRLAIPDPARAEVEILTSIDGLDFDAVYQRGVGLQIDGYDVRVPSPEDLITSKRIAVGKIQAQIAAGKPQQNPAEVQRWIDGDNRDIALLEQLILSRG